MGSIILAVLTCVDLSTRSTSSIEHRFQPQTLEDKNSKLVRCNWTAHVPPFERRLKAMLRGVAKKETKQNKSGQNQKKEHPPGVEVD